MIMKLAAAWLFGSLAPNPDMASAWQQWQQPSNQYIHNANNMNRFQKPRPSYMYLDNYDPNSFQHDNSSEESAYNELPQGTASRSRGMNHRPKRKSYTNSNNFNLNKDSSFHNYPSHFTQVDKQRTDIKRRKRSKLASSRSRGNSSAILPSKTKRNNNKQYSNANLLTFQEETEIAYAIQDYAKAIRIKDDLCSWMSREKSSSSRISGLKELPSEEHWASACSLTVPQLHHLIQRGQEAKAKLVSGNVGLVTMIAKKYHHLLIQKVGVSAGTLKLDDLIQEGYIGIMDAAERFDPEKGFRFSTYGSYWIRQRMLRSISESSRIIRLPEHVQTMMRNIEKKRKEFEELSGRSPSIPELAYELSISVEKVTLYQHLNRHNVMSLEHQLNQHSTKDEKKITVGDKLACNEIPTPDEDAMSEAFRGEVHSMLDHLGDNERWVLTHRFGLEDGYPRTLREISEEMSVSLDIVKDIQTKALNKLRQPGMMYKLKDFMDGGGREEASWDHHATNGMDHNGMNNGWMNHNGMNHNSYNSHNDGMNHHNWMEPSALPIEGHNNNLVDQQSMLNGMSQQMYTNGARLDEDDLDENERPTPESIWSW